MTHAVLVLSTVARHEDADRIARALVDRRLAACVNLVPGVRSIYRWKGGIESDDELLLVIKSTSDRLEALREAIVSLHPYEVPELIAVPIEFGHAPYLAWLEESTRG